MEETIKSAIKRLFSPKCSICGMPLPENEKSYESKSIGKKKHRYCSICYHLNILNNRKK